MIFITGEINEEAFEIFAKALASHKGSGAVKVTLMSSGGDAAVALAFYDLISLSPHSIHITGTGCVHSAAVLILAAGDVRRLTANAWVMVHEEQLCGEALGVMSVSQLEKQATHNRRIENHWNRCMAESTNTDSYEWGVMHKNETYLDANECLALGLIEEVI